MNDIAFGSNMQDFSISVQALLVTPDDILWVLNTGQPSTNESTVLTMPYTAYGGPKLVAINLSNNSVARTYTFPHYVRYPDSVHERHTFRHTSRRHGIRAGHRI